MSDKPKRAIDRRRDAAISMTIGSPDDCTEIVQMLVINSRLHVVTGRSIYALHLADETDPERTNPAIPNSQQRVLDIGADDPIVAKLLLTAHALLRRTYLGNTFDEDRSIALAWELTKHVTAMANARIELEASEKESIEIFAHTGRAQSDLRLPTIGNAEHRFHNFAQKLGHAVDAMKEIARLFYRDLPKKWIDALTDRTVERYGADDGFAKFMLQTKPTLLFLREIRNMVEHAKPDRQIKVFDFRLLPSGEILAPSVEISWPQRSTAPQSLVLLMSELTQTTTLVAEVLMAHLCDAHVQPFGSFGIQVVELPLGERPHPNVRMSYGAYHNGQVIRIG